MRESEVYSGNYKSAAAQAKARSKGICQLCGQRPTKGLQAHHWAIVYPSGEEVTADDLTALCGRCHLLATEIRRGEIAPKKWQRKRARKRDLAARNESVNADFEGGLEPHEIALKHGVSKRTVYRILKAGFLA